MTNRCQRGGSPAALPNSEDHVVALANRDGATAGNTLQGSPRMTHAGSTGDDLQLPDVCRTPSTASAILISLSFSTLFASVLKTSMLRAFDGRQPRQHRVDQRELRQELHLALLGYGGPHPGERQKVIFRAG